MLTRELPRDIAKHLVHTYGTTATKVVDVGDDNKLKGAIGQNERIHPDYPFLKSEISYAARHELAQKPNDIICRRVPIAFLSEAAAKTILPEVIEIMSKERKWSSAKKAEEMKEA